MTTINSVGNGLSGSTGSGTFVGATSPTITTPKITQINDANGNEILNLNAATSAVNYIQLNNSSATNVTSIINQGTDTNIGILIATKGTGSINLYSNGGATANLIATSLSNSAVNYIATYNSITGNAPQVGARGSDTNITLLLNGQGTGGAAVHGSSTNDNAAAGYVGEYVSSVIAVASAVSCTNNTSRDITSISLTAGDWDVWGNIGLNGGATTLLMYFSGWISTTSATTPDPSLWAGNSYGTAGLAVFAENEVGSVVPFTRVSVSTTTNVYLSVVAGFSTSTCIAYGGIFARRVR